VRWQGNPGDQVLRLLLERTQRIAVIGLSPKPERDSNRVARYLLQQGYAIVPVYPRGEEILGEKAYRCLAEVPGPVDLVNVFRRSEELSGVVDEALAVGAPALWLQLGCVHAEAAAKARAAAVLVVMDRCLMVEHARLMGRR
jgi:predicted CoA-binding protein